MADTLVLGGHEFQSRFILGSGKYNLKLIKAAVEQGGAQIITLALRRANTQEKENILDFIPEGVTLLPNTSGARNAEEAVRIARLSRAMGCGDFVKVEIMHDAKYLFPDNYETIKATEVLAKEGFIVLPYMNPDLNVARDLQNAGAAAVMPRLFERIRDALRRVASVRGIGNDPNLHSLLLRRSEFGRKRRVVKLRARIAALTYRVAHDNERGLFHFIFLCAGSKR